MPTQFMRAAAREILGRELNSTFAVGMVFMSRATEAGQGAVGI